MKTDIALGTFRSCLVGPQKDPDMDALAELAAALTGKPYALITMLDGPVCWTKAECGISVRPVPRELSFCSTCVELDDVLVVEDAREDSRFAELPWVACRSGIRFYAGVPVQVQVGTLTIQATLCVLDIFPGALDEEALKNLVLLGQLLKSLLTAKLSAAMDHVTGLWNKRTLEETLGAMIARYRNSDTEVNFALLDIDHFKQINDGYGHDAGDRVLQAVSQRLHSLSGQDHVVGRIGGDEFGIILVSRDHAGAAAFLQSLPARLSFEGDHGRPVSVTSGYAHLGPGMADAAGLIKAADLALYEAKRRQRGTAFRYGDLAA